VKYNQQY